jgi:hypothetical protein
VSAFSIADFRFSIEEPHMALYSELPTADKAIVNNAANLIRAGCGELARIFNHVKAIADDANAVALVTSIDAGDTIPNASGLAGADDLTRTELVAAYTLLNTIRTTYDTSQNRAAMSKAAGINAMLG